MRMSLHHVSVCSVEKLKQRLQDADENTIDLGQDTIKVISKPLHFNRDVLKSITVTVQQHRPTGGTQTEEKDDVRPSLDFMCFRTAEQTTQAPDCLSLSIKQCLTVLCSFNQ